MSIIAEFDVQNPHSALSNALEAVPDVELEIVQQAGTDPDRPYMFVWASATDVEAWEAAMAADETVGNVERYTRMDGDVLYRMQITSAAESVSYGMWVSLGGEQLEATWSDGWWHIRMRFPDREKLGQCEDWCGDHDVAFELRRIYSDPINERAGHGLTTEQREALTVAHEMGYFDVPRNATLGDVADELGVAPPSLSERLRRAQSHLVGRLRAAEGDIKPRIN